MSVGSVEDARVLTCTPSQAAQIPQRLFLGVCAGNRVDELVDVDLFPSSESTALVLSPTQRDAQLTKAVKERGILTLNAAARLARDWREIADCYADSVRVLRVREKFKFLSDDEICNDRVIKA